MNTIYVRKRGVGVRREKFRYVILSEKTNMLTYDVPCVCGSLTHRSRRHRDCLLNTKYMDL